MMNFLENKAAQGRLQGSEGQQAATEMSIRLQKEALISCQEGMKERQKKLDNVRANMWFEGFREGLKRKVSLVQSGSGWSYKLTIGQGHSSIVGEHTYQCPIKAMEAGYRKQKSLYADKFKGEV